MPQKSSRQYYDELADLSFSDLGNSKRALKIYDILGDRGFDPAEVGDHISQGLDRLPPKWKTGGLVKRKSGGKIMQGYKAGGKV